MKSSTEKKLTVLHDWDNPFNGGKWYFIRGLKYILYGICKKFGFRPKILSDIYEEPKRKAELIAMLNNLIGVNSIFGIRDCVKNEFPEIWEKLETKYHAEVRRHIHMGKHPGPNIEVLWEPTLNQRRKTWNYDEHYTRGEKVLLEEGELPIWHVNEDSNKCFEGYIRFLYNVIVKGEKIYRDSKPDSPKNRKRQ